MFTGRGYSVSLLGCLFSELQRVFDRLAINDANTGSALLFLPQDYFASLTWFFVGWCCYHFCTQAPKKCSGYGYQRDSFGCLDQLFQGHVDASIDLSPGEQQTGLV